MSVYQVPQPSVISFSGGRTSGFLLFHILQAYKGTLPDNIHVLFANTGVERKKTLDFVQECSVRWQVPITWLEYDWDAPHRLRVVDYATASRHGEPFAALIDRKGFVPNATMRFCTSHLKRDPIDRFARYWLEFPRWHSVIGLRFDEPRRVESMLKSNCRRWRTGSRPCLPLHEAGVTVSQIAAFWRSQPFDLGSWPDESNCSLCFLKGREKLMRIIRNQPELADWWVEQENVVRDRPGPNGAACTSMKRFRGNETYSQLRESALAQLSFLDVLDTEIESHDCFCTD